MFTVFSLRNSVPLSSDESAAVFRVLDDYCRTPAGEWLRNFPFRRFNLRWCQSMTDAVMGAFLPAKPWTIYLMPADTGEESEPEPAAVSARLVEQSRISWAQFMTVTVIHELRHAWQFRKCWWLYVLCSLPLLRAFTLERDAERIAREAEHIVEQTIAWHDGVAFQRRWRK